MARLPFPDDAPHASVLWRTATDDRNRCIAHMHRPWLSVRVMSVRLVAAFLFGLVLAHASPAQAVGWTQPKGEYYLKFWNRSLIGKQVFISERTTASLPESFQDHQLHFYGEYGLWDDLTLTFEGTPVGYARFGDESRFYSAGGSAGLRYRLINDAVIAAVEVKIGGRPRSGSLAQGTVQVERDDRIDTELFDAAPSIGAGHGSLELQIAYGFPFFWMNASGGVRAFTNTQLNPALFLGGQIGWNSSFGLVLDLHANWFYSIGDIGPINVYGAAQTRYLGFGVGASYWFTDHVSVYAGFDSAFFATANAATPAFALGLEFK